MKSEELLQSSIVDLVRRCCPEIKIFSSLNGVYLGSKQPGAYVSKLKKLGLCPGEPDLRLHWKDLSNNPKTLYLECKVKPNKPTKLQADCMADLTALGFPCEVIYSLNEAVAFLRLYGAPMPRLSV